jgi:hypothetical protein
MTASSGRNNQDKDTLIACAARKSTEQKSRSHEFAGKPKKKKRADESARGTIEIGK